MFADNFTMIGSLILGCAASGALAAWLVMRKYRGPFRQAEKLVAELLSAYETPSHERIAASREEDLVDDLERLVAKQRQLTQQISQEEFNLQTILAGMMEALMVVDSRRLIRLVNPQFIKFFDVGEAPLNRTFLEVAREAEIELMLRETLRSGEAHKREITVARQSALPRVLEVSAVPVKDKAGQVNGVVTIFYDISRLKQLEEMRREFVGNVSHELRTPLSIFSGYLETLLDNPKQPPKELHRILQVMERHSIRLNLLVDDLLSLARLESDAPGLRLAPLRLQPFVRQVLSDWRLKLEARRLTVAVEADPDLLWVDADEGRLEQVMHNLLDNAVKYSPEGKSLAVRVTSEKGQAILSVADEGSGIPAPDLPHIFERFYRVDKARSREQGGTGLGLSIVKHIVLSHGGNVTAESVLGQGTVVRICLPLRPEPAD